MKAKTIAARLLEDEDFDHKAYAMSMPDERWAEIYETHGSQAINWLRAIDANGAGDVLADITGGHPHSWNNLPAMFTNKEVRIRLPGEDLIEEGGFLMVWNHEQSYVIVYKDTLKKLAEDDDFDHKEYIMSMRRPPLASIKSWFDGDTLSWELFYDGESQGFHWSTNDAIERAARDGAVWPNGPPALSHISRKD